MMHKQKQIIRVFLAMAVLTVAAELPAQNNADNPQMQALLEQAQAGDVGAQYLLGFMYAEGQGIERNMTEAVKWYTQAAEQGHADAQLTLGMMYAEGQGVPRDEQKAVDWYTRAAEQGNAGVQMILAMMYADGQGTVEDLVESFKWTLLAEANGRDVAGHKQQLAAGMSDEQIARARRMATAFAEQHPASVKTAGDLHGPVKYISETEGFSMIFPTPPERTVVQDNERLLAIHYQSLTHQGDVQYNASFQYFKQKKMTDPDRQANFLEDYLVGRAMFAWQNRIQKKEITFHGFPAATFKHFTFTGGSKTVHEGLIFLMNGNCVSLSCVYPAAVSPSPSFDDFINAFELMENNAKSADSAETQPEQAEMEDLAEEIVETAP